MRRSVCSRIRCVAVGCLSVDCFMPHSLYYVLRVLWVVVVSEAALAYIHRYCFIPSVLAAFTGAKRGGILPRLLLSSAASE